MRCEPRLNISIQESHQKQIKIKHSFVFLCLVFLYFLNQIITN